MMKKKHKTTKITSLRRSEKNGKSGLVFYFRKIEKERKNNTIVI